MTKLKIQGTPSTAAANALEPHVRRFYSRPNLRQLVIAELHHIERTQVVPDGEQQPSVAMRIAAVEVPDAEQEDGLRDAMRALYLIRTASGTINEGGELELGKQTVRLLKGDLTLAATARLSAGLNHWSGYLKRVQDNGRLTVLEIRHELDVIQGGLMDLLSGGSGQQALDLDDDPDAAPDGAP